MAHPAPDSVGPQVTSSGLDSSGFTTLLRDVLQGLGCTLAPTYLGQQYREPDFGSLHYGVDMTLPEHPHSVDWPRWQFHTNAVTFDVAMEMAAYDALRTVCDYHRRALAGTPAALFPSAIHNSADWYASMTSAVQAARAGGVSHLTALMDYAGYLGGIYYSSIIEHRAAWSTAVAAHRQGVATESHSAALLAQQLQDILQQIAAKDGQIGELRQLRQVQIQQLADRDQQIHQLEQELQDADQNLNDFHDQMHDMDIQIEDLEAHVQALQNDLAAWQHGQLAPVAPEPGPEVVQGDSGLDSEELPPANAGEVLSDADSAPVPPQ